MDEAKRIVEEYHPNDEMLQDALSENTFRMKGRHGEAFAIDYFKTATRQRLPVSSALDKWMQEANGIAEGTKVKYKGHVGAFIEWSNDVEIKKVDHRIARRIRLPC